MKKVLIPKNNGKFRKIYIPDFHEKIKLRQLVGQLESKCRKLSPENVVHGFTIGKSPITNALAHVGYQFTLSFDLKDFFDTVTPVHVKQYLTEKEIELCFVDGIAGQGLPTSPTVANIAASKMDLAILNMKEKHNLEFVYTRYADDLTFSFNDSEIKKVLEKEIPQIVGRCGFKLNKDKTHFQSAKQGRIIITGVAVDKEGIHPTRKIKRKLRAAKHQNNTSSAKGLEEFAKLKKPRINHLANIDRAAIDRLTSLWKLPKINFKELPNKGGEENLGDDVIITDDIPYTLGCSTYTTGWTSCLSQPNGPKRRSVLLWLYLEGTKIAGLLSEKTKTFAGIERKVLRARCLVHTLRNGKRVYDRLYGHTKDVEILKKKLEANNIMSVNHPQYSGEKVVGSVKLKYRAWTDSLTIRKTYIKGKGRKVLVC